MQDSRLHHHSHHHHQLGAPQFTSTKTNLSPSHHDMYSTTLSSSSSLTSAQQQQQQHQQQNQQQHQQNGNKLPTSPPLLKSTASSSSLSTPKAATEWVRLNIGGKCFLTTKTTLCRNHNSFFFKLLQDDPSIALMTDKDETGAYLIDRDPQYFAPILNYLRHGKLVIEKNLREEGVLEEAEFYNLPDLIYLVKERIKEREELKNSKQNTKRVFRVIQFKESEITQMMSTMSDGWKFEQIVNVGSQYNYANDDHSEYLLIVSKEYGAHEIITADLEGSDKRKKIVRHA